MISLCVRENRWEARIDKYLSDLLWLSRNFIARLLEWKYIYIAKIDNNKPIDQVRSIDWNNDISPENQIFPKKSYIPLVHDNIYITNTDRFEDSGILAESPNININILYSNHLEPEKSDYLIIYKPKWVLSHPNSVRDVESPSISGWMYHRFWKLPNIGNFIRAGLVHRLDKETDGLMIVVLTEKWLNHFQNLFQSKSLGKTLKEKEAVPFHKFYRAVCDVNPLGRNFLLEITEKMPYIISEPVIPKVPYYPNDVIGITKIASYEYIYHGHSLTDVSFGQRANLFVEILTGKTHQIRYHLSKHGLPIVWDYLYNNGFDPKWLPMQLTAYRLDWQDIDGSYKTLWL